MSDSSLLQLLAQSILTVSKIHHVKLEACTHEVAGYACWLSGSTFEAELFFQQALQGSDFENSMSKLSLQQPQPNKSKAEINGVHYRSAQVTSFSNPWN